MRRAIAPSAAVADLLRTRRRQLGLTLREVEAQAEALGRPIPFTVIARIERGVVEPGLPRLSVLLRLYDLPFEVAAELAELEQFAGDVPDRPTVTYEEAVARWKSGDLKTAMAHLLALKGRAAEDPAARRVRQKALLTFAVAAGSLGKYRLSRHIVDELLLEPPDRSLLVPALAQLATCWHWLGSGELALTLLERAESLLDPQDHQQRAWVLHNRASTLVTLARYDDAQRQIEAAREAYRAAKDAYGEGRARGVLVRLSIGRGDLQGALRAARAALEEAAEKKHERLAVMRRIDEGRILLALDRPADAADALDRALVQAMTSKDEVSRFHAHFYLWKVHTRLGDPDRADLELRAAQYYVRYLDDQTSEAAEIRQLRAGRLGGTPATGRAGAVPTGRGKGRKPRRRKRH